MWHRLHKVLLHILTRNRTRLHRLLHRVHVRLHAGNLSLRQRLHRLSRHLLQRLSGVLHARNSGLRIIDRRILRRCIKLISHLLRCLRDGILSVKGRLLLLCLPASRQTLRPALLLICIWGRSGYLADHRIDRIHRLLNRTTYCVAQVIRIHFVSHDKLTTFIVKSILTESKSSDSTAH